jgi:hypothetical protein
MRRHSVTEGTRGEILAELDQYRSDRTAHSQPEKAARYAQAVRAVEAGALEVQIKHAVYRVLYEPRPPQYITVEREREKILGELEDGRRARSNADAAMAFEHAIAAVEAGALAVFAGGVMYRVVED